jgi:hypothetical protein
VRGKSIGLPNSHKAESRVRYRPGIISILSFDIQLNKITFATILVQKRTYEYHKD